jgi:glucokinase
LNSDRTLLLAVDIGGTKLAVGTVVRDDLLRGNGFATLRKEAIPQPGDPPTVIARVIELAREIVGDATIERIGISIGGPLDHERGVVVNFPHLPGWKNIPLCDELSLALGAPALLDNDANLGALAEHRLGAGRGVDDLVYLTLSTGIGGGIVIGGNVVHGVSSAAAEMGHITVQTDGPFCDCGNRGCLERMASGTNIARTARELLAMRPSEGARLRELVDGRIAAITAAHVARATLEGDALAAEVWDRAMRYIAIGLASIIHMLAPPLIVLGGGVAQAGDALVEPIRRHLRNHVFYVPLDRIAIVTAELGHDSAVLGAAVMAAASGVSITQ